MKKIKFPIIVFSAIILLSTSSCEELFSDDSWDSEGNDTNALDESYMGYFSGTGDVDSPSLEVSSKGEFAGVWITDAGGEYGVKTEVEYPTNNRALTWENKVFTKSGTVDIVLGNKHYVGSVSFGANKNSGSIKYYVVKDGSEEYMGSYKWRCTR